MELMELLLAAPFLEEAHGEGGGARAPRQCCPIRSPQRHNCNRNLSLPTPLVLAGAVRRREPNTAQATKRATWGGGGAATVSCAAERRG